MAMKRDASVPDYGWSATRVSVPSRSRTRARKLERVVSRGTGPVVLTHGDERVELPAELVRAVLVIARAAGSGEAVTVVIGAKTKERELSSQAVADILNVSRPHVVKLAREGTIPYRKVGNRHRFREVDVLAYRQLAAQQREHVLGELAPAEGYVAGDF